MPSRRGAIALTDDEQKKFLEDGWTIQIASNGLKGYPHLVAMWYVVIDGKVHFTTFGKSQKVLNLRRNSKITCMLESGKGYAELRGLVIEGEGELVEDPAFTAKVMGLVGREVQRHSRPDGDLGAGVQGCDQARRRAGEPRRHLQLGP